MSSCTLIQDEVLFRYNKRFKVEIDLRTGDPVEIRRLIERLRDKKTQAGISSNWMDDLADIIERK